MSLIINDFLKTQFNPKVIQIFLIFRFFLLFSNFTTWIVHFFFIIVFSSEAKMSPKKVFRGRSFSNSNRGQSSNQSNSTDVSTIDAGNSAATTSTDAGSPVEASTDDGNSVQTTTTNAEKSLSTISANGGST